ncbi:RloB family protein [Frankia sp. AiPa1]|uniref:RloB family protein n=1 Tax=Frankia sp. AiPa1 TaxID=573492 RepID=UPI0027E54780|nr:RloB family protein [Frankia sp. AiPa1]
MFCEGEHSEPDYINGVKRLPEVAASTSISIEIDPERGVPLKLVQRAIVRSREPETDECWCVFDVEWPENHPNLAQAVSLAHQHGIRVAISNPCFELWLLLHFEDYRRFVNTKEVERRSMKWDGRTGKHIDAAQYMSRRKTAIIRARALEAQHEQNGVAFPNNNPSSSMADLLLAIDRQSATDGVHPS